MVEKQYRERLNAHFEGLLAKIPPEALEASGINVRGSMKNVTKTETLMLAEQYIRGLQREQSVLEGANKELETEFEQLKMAWEAAGGMVMP